MRYEGGRHGVWLSAASEPPSWFDALTSLDVGTRELLATAARDALTQWLIDRPTEAGFRDKVCTGGNAVSVTGDAELSVVNEILQHVVDNARSDPVTGTLLKQV